MGKQKISWIYVVLFPLVLCVVAWVVSVVSAQSPSLPSNWGHVSNDSARSGATPARDNLLDTPLSSSSQQIRTVQDLLKAIAGVFPGPTVAAVTDEVLQLDCPRPNQANLTVRSALELLGQITPAVWQVDQNTLLIETRSASSSLPAALVKDLTKAPTDMIVLQFVHSLTAAPFSQLKTFYEASHSLRLEELEEQQIQMVRSLLRHHEMKVDNRAMWEYPAADIRLNVEQEWGFTLTIDGVKGGLILRLWPPRPEMLAAGANPAANPLPPKVKVEEGAEGRVRFDQSVLTLKELAQAISAPQRKAIVVSKGLEDRKVFVNAVDVSGSDLERWVTTVTWTTLREVGETRFLAPAIDHLALEFIWLCRTWNKLKGFPTVNPFEKVLTAGKKEVPLSELDPEQQRLILDTVGRSRSKMPQLAKFSDGDLLERAKLYILGSLTLKCYVFEVGSTHERPLTTLGFGADFNTERYPALGHPSRY